MLASAPSKPVAQISSNKKATLTVAFLHITELIFNSYKMRLWYIRWDFFEDAIALLATDAFVTRLPSVDSTAILALRLLHGSGQLHTLSTPTLARPPHDPLILRRFTIYPTDIKRTVVINNPNVTKNSATSILLTCL